MEPVFEQVWRENPFTQLEYTDRYTPEIARQEGAKHGAIQMQEVILKKLHAIKSPTKQVQAIIKEIEAIDYE